jgi:hypothetical protein
LTLRLRRGSGDTTAKACHAPDALDRFGVAFPWAGNGYSVVESETTMQATIGDTLHIHGKVVGRREQTAKIIEVLGANGKPPFRVRYEDDHESVIFPGPDAVVERRSD